MGEVYSKSSGGTSRKYIEGKNGSDSNSVGIGNTVVAGKNRFITIGNIGAGKQNVEVYVKCIHCRNDPGDHGELWLVGITYDESSGDITIEMRSSSATSIYRYCEWIAFYD